MGSVITFYSFKGGVGRTMALANIAILLAQRGLHVLVVDADLEAPGLDRYFAPYGLPPVAEHPGLLELLERAPEERPAWEHFVSTIDVEGGHSLSVLTSGRRDETYARRVLEFEWEPFFRERGGGDFFEGLRNAWKAEFNLVLIDSRTGITDSGGVLTIQMPDILVLVASPNNQSISGVREVAEQAQAARQRLPYDRMPLSVLPILSRLDTRAEYKQSRKWLDFFAHEMEGFYADWLPKPFTPRQIIEQTKLPYVAYFSFGEQLPVLTEGTSDPEGLGFVYESLAALLAKDLAEAEQIVETRDTYVATGASTTDTYDIFLWTDTSSEHWGDRLLTELKRRSPSLKVFGLGELTPGDYWPDLAKEVAKTARMAVLVAGDETTDLEGNSEIEVLLDRARQDRKSIPILPFLARHPFFGARPIPTLWGYKTSSLNADTFEDAVSQILAVLKRTRLHPKNGS